MEFIKKEEIEAIQLQSYNYVKQKQTMTQNSIASSKLNWNMHVRKKK